MKRRKLLTSTGVLAGAALTGCGGGSEEIAGSEIGSEIAAYTVPAALVALDGHYQVEVTFGLMRGTIVKLHSVNLNGSGFTADLADKPVTGGHSHKVGFAKLRLTNEPKRNYKAQKLEVIEYINNPDGRTVTAWTHYAGRGAPTTGNNVQYTYYPENEEYEWKFYSADPALAKGQKRLFCRVSFFKLPDTERYDPVNEHFDSTNLYAKAISNNATIANANVRGDRYNSAFYRSQHMPTSYLHDTHESLSKKAPKGGVHDTVAVRDHRQPVNYFGLVPTLQGASPELRPMLERHLLRHIRQLGKKQASVSAINGAEDVDQHHLIHNETMRLLGGESYVESLTEIRISVLNEMSTVFASLNNSIGTFANGLTQELFSDQLNSMGARQLSEAGSEANRGWDEGYAITDTIAVQFGGKSPGPLFGFSEGFGFRLSAPGYSASAIYSDGAPLGFNQFWDYRDGVKKLGIVLIGKWFKLGVISADIELTFNIAWGNGGFMFESVILDPVFDIDMRTATAKLVMEGVDYASYKVDATFNRIVNYMRPLRFTEMEDLELNETGLEMVRRPVPSSGLDSLPDSMEFAAQANVQDANDAIASPSREDDPDTAFNTLEFSPLRIKILHANLGQPLTSATPAFALTGGVGVCPGVKWIYGKGLRFIDGLLYLRIVNVLDIAVVKGSQSFLEKQGLAYNS